MDATIAIAGNPNSGKTTLFNELTGARQHVGNYPGVTVEKKEGIYKRGEIRFNIVDLPGTYSLTTYSLEEVVTRDFLINEKPEMVINVVDASNIERNLYLTLQFMEIGIPVFIALNMMDVAERRGIRIDVKKLSKLLGVPVVPTVARKGTGKHELMADVAKNLGNKPTLLKISYGNDIDEAIEEIEGKIREEDFLTKHYNTRWVTLKYLERDEQILRLGSEENPSLSKEIELIVKRVSKHLNDTLDTYPEAVIADQRYGYINSILKQGVIQHHHDQDRLRTSDKIDKLTTNRVLGPIIMVAVLAGLYHFIFSYSEIPVGWIENFFGWLGGVVSSHLSDGLLKSLIISGIIDGVGGVLGFVPLIMFMFLGISVLEDSGYLARVAFMLDRIFQVFGLHGSSVMAYIISGGIAGGCAVPGVLATRTLKSQKERLATLLTVPFMNCGAKLPIFALMISAFFSKHEALVMIIVTLIAWVGALLAAKLMRITVIKGEATPFVMELPPYRLPTLKGLLIHTWERTWQYIKKAGTIILGISILLWAMMTFPQLPESQTEMFSQKREAIISSAPTAITDKIGANNDGEELLREALILKDEVTAIDAKEAEAALRHSVAGRIGTSLEGVTKFAGFDWRTNIALVGGFAAKEVVVSTLGTAYSLGDVDPENSSSLSETLKNSPSWSPLVAFSLIIFTIFYAPCFVTVVCISRETGTWKWGAFSIIFNTAIAYGMSVLVFQLGSLFI